MRSFNKMLLILIALIFLIQCEKYDVVNEIPEERFVFNVGDTLRYICSNGLVDTFSVVSYRFYETTGEADNLWGFPGSVTYKTDHCYIYLESVNNVSKIHLGAQCDLTPGYTFTFTGVYDNETESFLESGCGSEYGMQYPLLKMTDKIFNQNEFLDVYFTELSEQPYIIYWNLKYGIIRFEGTNEATGIYWNLDDKLLSSQ